MERREALIIINALPEIGPVRLQSLLECWPDPVQILGAPVSSLLAVPRLGERCAQTLHDWPRFFNLREEELRVRQAGVRIITIEDACYPAALREIHDPPICLYVHGNIEALCECNRMIAMVGSRVTTGYGEAMARQFATDAVRSGWVVVSGLARGIDTICHESTVSAGGRTIAVLGSGFLHVYPEENIDLARRIAEGGGAVVSEFPMGQKPDRRNFPMRNRIISGLCRGTLVVEAGLRSGSLITAAQAMEQGRAVFAIPGRVDGPFAHGCNALIRDGARLVESFGDIMEEFSLLPSLDERRRDRERQQSQAAVLSIPVSPHEFRVWQQIGHSGCGVDDLVTRLDEPASTVLGILLMLEIKQLIEQLPGKRLRQLPNRVAVDDSVPKPG